MSDTFDNFVEVVPLLGHEEVTVDLSPPNTSELKTLAPETLGSIDRTGYYVTFQRLFEVHGRWDSQKTDNASLLAIKICPGTKHRNHHFKELTITMTLELPESERRNATAPHFASYEPGLEGAWFIKEVSHKVTLNKEVEGNLGFEFPVGGQLSSKVAASRSEELERRLIHKIQAKPDWEKTKNSGASDGRTNQVAWTLTPAEKSDGIGDYFVVAMLVHRARGTGFMIRAQSDADITFFADSADKVFPWGRTVRLGEFGPASAKDQLIPKGVSPADLKQAADQNVLREIAFVHVPEKVDPRAVYARKSEGIVTTAGNAGSAAPSAVHLTTTSVATELSGASGPARRDQATPADPASRVTNISRALRHRRMAALYRRLAQLHMEEADEADGVQNTEAYVDEVLREETI